jgi:hypothetical protein
LSEVFLRWRQRADGHAPGKLQAVLTTNKPSKNRKKQINKPKYKLKPLAKQTNKQTKKSEASLH